MSSDSNIAVLLSILSGHPRPSVPLSVAMYNKYFRSLPPERRIYDASHNISVLFVNKEKALRLLKDRYKFFSTSELHKEISEANNA